MKLVLLADLHGNLPAALAMGEALETIAPDDCWFLGDAVGKGPDNAATCDWVRAHCSHFIGGNWDYGIGGKEYPADEYYWNQLGPERMRWLNGLPREGEMTMSGIRFRLFHGRPVSELMTDVTDRSVLEPFFQINGEPCGGLIFADSHRPFIRAVRTGYVMNTGSVGNSLGVPAAHALLLEGDFGSETRSLLRMTVLSVPYDNQEAVRRAEADPDLPHRDAWIREITTGIYSRQGVTG